MCTLKKIWHYCMKATRKCDRSNRATPILVLQKKLIETYIFAERILYKEISSLGRREEDKEESDAKKRRL